MDIPTALGFLAIGFVGGAFGAMVGLGGATFIIPLATIAIDPNVPHLRAAAMVSNLCVAAGAIVPYARAQQIDWRTVKLIAPWAMVTVALGVWMSIGIDPTLYKGLFGIFILAMVVREVLLLLRPPAVEATERKLSAAVAIATGMLAGLAAGVLSVGGGVVFVPVLREWLRLPVKRTAATSIAMVLPVVAVGAVAQLWSMSQLQHPAGGSMLPGALAIAACMAPAALAGGFAGAKLNTRLPKTTVAWVVVVALTIAAFLLMRPLWERLTLPTPA